MFKKIIGSLLLISTLSACGPTMKVSLMSEQETIPRPMFTVADYNEEGARPVYSRLNVYRVENRCEVPNCPLVWSAEVSDKWSPTKFYYGRDFGLGTLSLVNAQELEPNNTYEMIFLKNPLAENDVAGRYVFVVAEDGSVSPGRGR